jgi:nudix-type nucleoside diphosphatase (YffH/AdpP family)
MPIEIEKRDILYKGWNTFSLATIRLENGARITRSVEDHGAVAVVLAYDPERRTALLVRQFRAPVFIAADKPDLLEAVAGLIDEGDADDTTRREAMEEAGLRLGALEPVGILWSTPGSSTERLDLFLAPYRESDRVGDGGGLDHEHEDITVVEMPLAELARLADAGGLEDLKTFALVQTLRLRDPALFR